MSKKKLILDINPEIRQIFISKNIPVHDGVAYLLCLYYGVTPSFIPDELERRVLSTSIVTKDYSDDTTTIYSLGTDLTKEKLLNLIPDVEYPTLTVQSIDGGGLLAGSYQFAVAYKLKTGDYTDYSLLSPTYFAAPKYNESIKINI